MITNERQHRITKSQIKQFEGSIARAEQDGRDPGIDPRLHLAMIDGMCSQLDDLREELEQYEALREGKVKERVFHSLLEIPRALIEARIARRLTQKELGRKLGVPEQQIQRYERTRYSGVGIERLQEVADVLELKVEKTVEYSVPSRRPKQTTVSKGGGRKSTRPSRRFSKRTTVLSSEGGRQMAGRKTGKAAASAAGKTLASKSASKTAKRAAASDLAQVGNRKVTSKKAASSAGKTLASKRTSKAAKRAAASDLSQAARTKR